MSRALVLCLLVGCAGTTHRVATKSARASLQEFRGQVKSSDGLATQVLAGAAVTGALASLAEPVQQDRLDTLIASATDAAARGLVLGLRREAATFELVTAQATERVLDAATAQLAESLARGELHGAVSGLVRDISRATVLDSCLAIGAMFPECAELDCAHCLERKMSLLARSAAQGMTAEIADVMRIPVLVSVFVAGAAVALLVARVRRGRSTLPA